MRWPVLLIGVVIIIAFLVFAVSFGTPRGVGTTATTTATGTDILAGVSSVPYTNDELGFTILRPQNVEPQTSGFEGYISNDSKPVVGFTFPKDLFQRTNLVEAGIFIGISDSPEKVAACLQAADGEIAQGGDVLDGATFQTFSSQGAAAGNIYDRTSYRTVREKNCFEIVTMTHSGNIGNYPVGTVKQFDKNAVEKIFATMLSTFKFTVTMGSGVEGKVHMTCLIDQNDAACLPQVFTIQAYQGVSSVALYKSAIDGSFRMALPAGQYELRVDTASSTHCASVGVVVPDDSYIATNISCQVGGQEQAWAE